WAGGAGGARASLHEFVEAAGGALELALLGQFVPDGARVLVRRDDGDDVGFPPAGHGPLADPEARLVVEPGQLDPLLERREGVLQGFGSDLGGLGGRGGGGRGGPGYRGKFRSRVVGSGVGGGGRSRRRRRGSRGG